MPEGHTLHKAARRQRPLLTDKVVRATSPQQRFIDVTKLDGARVTDVQAFGKHLFYSFRRARASAVLHVHLGLAGRFTYHRTTRKPAPDPRASTRLRLQTDEDVVDLRGPLVCEVVSPQQADEAQQALGPDPIRPRTSPAKFRARLARSRVAIGALLLDQAVIAGIGNVYRAEILFLAGIDPRRPASSLSAAEAQRLWELARQLLRAGVTDGRILTTRYGSIAAPGWRRTYVYKQRQCLGCQGAVDHVKLAGRPCFFCPRCQH